MRDGVECCGVGNFFFGFDRVATIIITAIVAIKPYGHGRIICITIATARNNTISPKVRRNPTLSRDITV